MQSWHRSLRLRREKYMDDFEKNLKADAAKIQADVSPELAARIASSVHATKREAKKTADNDASSGSPFSLWWLSSLTGLVAAVLVIAVLNRNLETNPQVPEEVSTVTVVPKYVRQLREDFVLRTENAEFTEPLEDELEKLRADIEKARKNVEQDLRSTF